MSHRKQLERIKTLYDKGENIIQFLKSQASRQQNTDEDILISYDLQAGSYTQLIKERYDLFSPIFEEYVAVINALGPINSLVEVGVGEATTLANVWRQLANRPQFVGGFDISWSRVRCAKRYFSEINPSVDAQLVVGNLFESPYADNSIDVVYTSHSIEPNGGREAEALSELYRIASRYVVLFEPAYELTDNQAAKERMRSHGYITRILETCRELGYHVAQARLMKHPVNPLNPTGLFLIEKSASAPPKEADLCCPVTKSIFVTSSDSGSLFSPGSLLAYPVIQGIPCLLPENGVVATHYLD